MEQFQQLPDALFEELYSYYQYLLVKRADAPPFSRLSKEEYLAEIRKAEADIDAGNYTTLEDFQDESDQWT